MIDIHIEEFYKDAARILIQLHDSFPRKSTIYVEDIAGEDNPDEFGLHSKRHLSCFGTMLWLSEEGYLRFEDTIKQDAIDQAILTQKSLIIFSATQFKPDPLQDPQEPHTNIEIVRKTLKSGTSTQLAQIMQQVLFKG